MTGALGHGIGLVGVPTSAGAFAPGQEQAPAALRSAGLVDSLRASGVEVHDHGDRELWRWRPDRDNRRAQNLENVVDIVRDTARRVGEAIERTETTLVLGGDCTVGIGTVSGHVATGDRVGLIYFDTHADLNVPESVREGALDWMGVAHMLGEQGACPSWSTPVRISARARSDRAARVGAGASHRIRTRCVIARREIATVPVDEVAKDPEAAAARARDMLEGRCDRLLVHFDVDVIDFTDVPLSENWGRNEGVSFDVAQRTFAELAGSPRLAGVTITELNPDHAEQGAHGIERFATGIAAGLARAFVRP